MPGKVFINHRRLLNEQDAEILFNRLVMGRHVAEKDLFIDRRSLNGAADWKSTLKEQVHASDVMVVLIGDGEIDGEAVSWLDLRFLEDHPMAGQRRLDDPDDQVRYEIVEAIDRGIPLVPVLVNGARMPLPEDGLPPELWPLTKPQTLEFRTKNGALPETYIPRIGAVIEARRTERRRSKANVSLKVALLMVITAAIFGVVIARVTPQLLNGHPPAEEITIRLLKDQINDYRELADAANLKAAARSPQFEEIDPTGPWGIKWEWVSPDCKGGYNIVVDHGGYVSVFGKKDVRMSGSGQALNNGRFFVKFAIDTGNYMLTVDGSIGTGSGEAQLHALDNLDGDPYCEGPVIVTRGRLPKTLVGDGNGN